MKTSRLLAAILALCAVATTALPGTKGTVYLVLGSDTAIWEGMNVGRYHCTYPLSLYTSPSRNAHAVMDPAWRTALRDSRGTPMKLTWWMMAGNIFRHATNTNVPLPNTMTLYLMQEYHGDAIRQFGDELSLHYHTFVWTDYDGDGRWWWNQANRFLESEDDWQVTLAQFLLEHRVFPVSFRSGWHAMDNDWQQVLDRILPYSLHNDWPGKHTDTVEPIDNVFDWSQAPSAWVPYHPSPGNYQIPGPGRGWNVRSEHIMRVDSALLAGMFAEADRGIDQVACLWGHLPETDFLQNLEKINDAAHRVDAAFPDVTFEYCTAVEAMQKWRKGADTTAPAVSVQEHVAGDAVTLTITSSEPVFQQTPFVALKDLYERYTVIPCAQTSAQEWTTTVPFDRTTAAKAGLALCDTLGNPTIEILRYRPDDIYLDNLDPSYAELAGAWTASSLASWGTDSRLAQLAAGDSAVVRWTVALDPLHAWNVFVQVPGQNDLADSVAVVVRRGGSAERCAVRIAPNRWNYAGTVPAGSAAVESVEIVAHGRAGSTLYAAADAVKLTPLVRPREIAVDPAVVVLGESSIEDTLAASLRVTNSGVEELTISALGLPASSGTGAAFPLVVPAMGSAEIPVWFYFTAMGPYVDTLTVASDDPLRPLLAVPVMADVQNHFVVLDNDDPVSYAETGSWHTSVAQAFGPTSRYAWLSEGAANRATFTATTPKPGLYEVLEIVPTTVNAADKALYIVRAGGVVIDSVIVDQNAGSGAWKLIGRYELPAAPVEVVVTASGLPAGPGAVVLRADAVKLALVGDPSGVAERGTLPASVELRQNYPNPFNPETTIEFALPDARPVTLTVYTVVGEEVANLADGFHRAGLHTVRFDASRLPSGVYFYRLRSGGTTVVRKAVLMR